MSRRALAACLVAGLCATAAGGELVELKDGTLHEAERVVVSGDRLVLHLARRDDVVNTQLHVRLRDVEPSSAVRAWAGTLGADATAEWLRLARFARANALFDVAELGYAHAAAGNQELADDLAAFRAARPQEESRHLLQAACEQLQAGRHRDAASAARRAIGADEDGAYAVMAAEILDALSGERLQPSAPSRDELQRLQRLERLAARGAARLAAVRWRPVHRHEATLASATRLLGDVAERLRRVLDQGPTPVTTRAQRALDDVLGRRADGLLHLADLQMARGARRSALSTIHDVLSFRPGLPAAVGLRDRLLDRIESDQVRERDLLLSGRRRVHHPYPYPARDVHSGIGLVPTWDPVRGLGRLPYSRSRSTRSRARPAAIRRAAAPRAPVRAAGPGVLGR